MSRAALEFIGQSGMGYSFDPLIPGSPVTNGVGRALKEFLYVKFHGQSMQPSLIILRPVQSCDVCSELVAHVYAISAKAGFSKVAPTARRSHYHFCAGPSSGPTSRDRSHDAQHISESLGEPKGDHQARR